MITEAVANALPIAIGIALSPLAIAALMIILMTRRAKINAPAFLLGWLLGFLVVGTLASLIPGVETEPGQHSTLPGCVRIALGVLLLFLALLQWLRRPLAGKEAPLPSFFGHLDDMEPSQSCLTGFLLSAAHPKNLPLIAAGVAAIGVYDLRLYAEIIAFSIFIAIASTTIILPIAAYFLAKRSAAALFKRWKNWLLRNNSIVMILLLFVFGVLLIGRGLKILAA